MVLTDAATRQLAHRFFDAIELRDIETIASLYAPELRFWFNVTGSETNREENLKAVTDGYALHRSRIYNDRTIDTFPGGFVAQYSLEIVQHSGTKTVLWACFVAQLNKDGIARIDEYLDSSKILAPAKGQGEGVVNDGEIRDLCNRFLDAYQDRRTDELAEIYAPDCVIWHNVFGRDTTAAENLDAAPKGYAMQRRRTYNDRIIDTFEGGFVVRYQLNGVQHSGHTGALWICIVGLCSEGKLTRIDEYLDSGKFASWRGSKHRAEAKEGT